MTTVGAPAGDSQTVPESVPDRRGTCRKLPDSLRRCQDRLRTYMRLPDGARSLKERRCTCRRLPKSLRRCQGNEVLLFA
ncbi:hypothetical protein DPMN_109272 [Dreissena polymorpha]|uniref:Uncharacterized protein n=1 Tax=Dreissena polymorpha TaxID=45954 RepID=A0A9D4QM01_DREPO|nr:hypothetical protein DPMN_109272 [Dreissena polymorpha]